MDQQHSREDEDVAFAAEAAANAVEEADLQQQWMDQSLMTCRICGKGGTEGRPLLHFPPMDPVLLPPSVSKPSTFYEHIYLHIFCGKTASILPSVCRPELEILSKAGIKNKHGIGHEVNAALARTRPAILLSVQGRNNDASTNRADKQFYLVKEFEAHLTAIRISSQSAVDSSDDSQLDFDLDVLATPPSAHPSPPRSGNKRKRAYSAGGQSTIGSIGEGHLPYASSKRLVSRQMQMPVMAGQQTGTMADATTINNALQVELPSIEYHVQQTVFGDPNYVTGPPLDHGKNARSDTTGAEQDWSVRPSNLSPGRLLSHQSGGVFHQQSQLLMYPEDPRLLLDAGSADLTSPGQRRHDESSTTYLVQFPLHATAAQITLSGNVDNGGTMFSSGLPVPFANVSASNSASPRLPSPRQHRESTLARLVTGTLAATTDKNGELERDVVGNLWVEEDTHASLGL